MVIFDLMNSNIHPLWEYFLWDYEVSVDFELPNIELIGMNDIAKKLHIRHKLLTQKKILEQQTHYKLLKRIIKEVDILAERQTLNLKKTAKGNVEKRFWKYRNDGNIDIVLRVGANEIFLLGMKGIRFVLPADWVEVLRFLVNLRDILKLGEDNEEFWEYDKVNLIKEAKKTFRLGYEQRKSREYEKERKSNQKSIQDFWDKQNAEWRKYMNEYLSKQKEEGKKNIKKTTFNDLFNEVYNKKNN